MTKLKVKKVKRMRERWCIAMGGGDLYVGSEFTKREAIADHIKMLECTWKECQGRGDSAVKVVISYYI